MNRCVAILFLSVIVIACKPETEYEKMAHYFESHSEGDLSQFEYVIVINEIGSCINCNNYFSKEMTKALKDDKVLFILSGNGTKVDMSGYIQKDHKNVIWDRPAHFDELKIVEKCAILEIKDKQIIEKTEIDINNLEKSTQFFFSKIF